ncbi:uncharacterized protein C1orf159 homolog isoform X2 [Lepisosteus oculatus]|uniref:uncharacterized protein C1orf159 homolog isoform X2 n=1 Tax=Lepisosteus oculatus TaxID=7918 RepID=UPI003715B033
MSSAAQRRGVLANGGRGRGRSGLTRGSTYPSDRAGTAIFCASRGSERSVPGRRVLRLRAMSLLCAAVLAGAALLLGGPGPGAPSVLPGQSDCCRDALEMNGTCLINAHCDPGCCLLTMENSTYVCVPWTMVNRTQYNLTECSSDDPNATVWLTNTSTVAPVRPKIGKDTPLKVCCSSAQAVQELLPPSCWEHSSSASSSSSLWLPPSTSNGPTSCPASSTGETKHQYCSPVKRLT